MKTFANVARMIADAARDAVLRHVLDCVKCGRSGMFDCVTALSLIKMATDGDRLREAGPRCEWDPEKDEPALIDFVTSERHVVRLGGCPNHQCYEIGEKVTFRVCEPCSKLPRFFGRPLRDISVEEALGL